MKKSSIRFIIPLLLTGCISIKSNVPFPEPKEGDRARIRVIIPKVFNNYRGVNGYPNSHCMSRNNVGGHVVSSYLFGFEKSSIGQKIGLPVTPFSENKEMATAEVYITANQPILFTYFTPPSANKPMVGSTVSSIRYYEGCTGKVSFIPKANEDYELIFPYTGNCQFKLTQLIDDKGIVSQIPLVTNEVPTCQKPTKADK